MAGNKSVNTKNPKIFKMLKDSVRSDFRNVEKSVDRDLEADKKFTI